MAAQTGLFTQGPSVDDILESRNKRSGDLQAQLMTQAAQGARDPASARAVSFLGSSLGRALGGAMGDGGNGREELEAQEAQKSALQQEALAVSNGTVAEKRAFVNKVQAFDPKYAQELNDRINLQQATEAKNLADKQASDAALKLTADKYATKQEQDQAALDLKAQQQLEDALVASADSEARIMEEEEAEAAMVSSQNTAIDMLGPNPDAKLVAAIKSGNKKSLEFAWAQITDKHKAGADAREVARIYGEGYEVGTDLNKKKLKEKFESSGVNTTVNVNTGSREAVDTDGFQLLSKIQHSNMQEDLLSTNKQLTKLQTIKDKFDPEHFGAYGEGRAAFGGFLDYMGIDEETYLGGDSVAFAAKRNLSQAEIGQLFNVYRKEVTGAAAAIAELAAIEKVYLNSKKGPAATLVMLDALIRVTTETQSTQKETLKRGIRVAEPKNWDTADAAAVRAAWRAANPEGVVIP